MMRHYLFSAGLGMGVFMIAMTLCNTESDSGTSISSHLTAQNIQASPGSSKSRFPDAGETPTPGWSGPVFQLSQDYPKTRPAPDERPWEKYDFASKKEWKGYLMAVLNYCLQGNVEVDWALQRNKVRNWYHAPWMHWGVNGREFTHGLTHERVSLPKELAPTQDKQYQNWAVGMYNASGGWILGRVWTNHDQPNPDALKEFPDGTVSVKLLFTQADPVTVPYLKGAKEWQAYIYEKTEFH